MGQEPAKEHDEEEPVQADRPLECTACKKPVAVKYTEILDQQMHTHAMCADCPILEKRLHGMAANNQKHKRQKEPAGLACGSCGTSLESVKMGSPLGCSECYEVFGDLLIGELLKSQRIPTRIAGTKKSTPIHIGRAPGETQEVNPSLRLLALNEALRETLKREDYEQAAQLRDQIKELTDNHCEDHAAKE